MAIALNQSNDRDDSLFRDEIKTILNLTSWLCPFRQVQSRQENNRRKYQASRPIITYKGFQIDTDSTMFSTNQIGP